MSPGDCEHLAAGLPGIFVYIQCVRWAGCRDLARCFASGLINSGCSGIGVWSEELFCPDFVQSAPD